MPKTKSPETWRDWTPEEAKKQPRRKCSVAGCLADPVRVRETTAPGGKPRKHVYCAPHAQEG